MRFRPLHLAALLLLGAGLAVTGVVALLTSHGPARAARATAPPPPPATTAPPPPATTAPPPPATTAPPPPATTAPPPTQPAPPQPVPMSWNDAGIIIVDPTAADPEWLGKIMRQSGFGWVALPLGHAGSLTAPPADWAPRFRAVSGLPVGGWSVLGGDPVHDAQEAANVVRGAGLSFYIADAEAPYNGRPDRSQAFVSAFRAVAPTLPAALSSYCDANGIGLAPWARAGFAFLPQAYVNDFGMGVSPAACVRAAAGVFPKARVHPTVACYGGQRGYVPPAQFSQLLAQAGTTGFSIFPGETLVRPEDWQTYAQAIVSQHIAVDVPPG